MSDVLLQAAVRVFSTGVPALDKALGVDGWPRGRVVEISSHVREAQQALALAAVAQAQKAGAVCAWVDCTHEFQVTAAEQAGVVLKDLLVAQPPEGLEQALEITATLVNSGAVDLLVLANGADAAGGAEAAGDAARASEGLLARLVSRMVRRLCTAVAHHGTLVLCTTRPARRSGLAGGSHAAFNSALKFYARVRVEVVALHGMKAESPYPCWAQVLKNKLAPPFLKSSFHISQGVVVDDSNVEGARP